MSAAAELDEKAMIRRAYDRLAFGAAPGQLATAQAGSAGAAIGGLLVPTGSDAAAAAIPAPKFDDVPKVGKDRTPASRKAKSAAVNQNMQLLESWWLHTVVAADHQIVERLTWFWQGHFATSIQKVKSGQLMWQQNTTERRLCRGSFTDLAKAMVVDPAMLVWLDGNNNTVKAPNENLSREYMELFSLGHGHYTETDVRQAARALTGWIVDKSTGKAKLVAKRQDTAAKTILGKTADFDASSFVDQVLAQPASAAFVIGRLWFRLVSMTPPDAATMSKLVAAYGPSRDIAATVKAITASAAFSSADSSLVKQPVEWLVGLLRAVGVKPMDYPAKEQKALLNGLRGMGQVPFTPPSVGGWPAGRAWLTTATAITRTHLARTVAQQSKSVAAATGTSSAARIDGLRRLLGVDAWTTRTVTALQKVADDPVAALTIAACSPEYVISR
ncbi:MAG: DUF1800 domain-containing protein [Actinomycetota bacterium]|nr:DUF1800 domain-containing protein [Actinomycetota bacterium]